MTTSKRNSRPIPPAPSKRHKSAPSKVKSAPTEPSKQGIIDDLLRVHAEFPDVTITRNFYRANGQYAEYRWGKYFPRFIDFLDAAGLRIKEEETPAPASNPAQAKKPKFVLPPETFVDEGPEKAGEWIEGDQYVYNGKLDTYTLFLRSTTKKQVIPGAQIRSMKRAYSNMGDGATINEIARAFAIRRDIFDEIRKILGWTHDSDVFTDEEILTRGTDALVEDAVSLGRSKLDQEYNRRSWRDTKRDADRYRQLDHFIVQPILDRMEDILPKYEAPLLHFPKSKTRFAAVTSSGELHFNKHGWIGETGQTYSREIADSRFAATTIAMINSVKLYGRPEKWIYAVGNDDLHVDNQESKTTGGTPQDVNGTGRQMVDEFFDLQVREIDRLRSIAPIVIKLSAGNHNTFLSYLVMKMLAIQYKNTKHVTVDVTAMMRAYELYGNTLMGFTHGHLVKPIKLMATMGVEACDQFSSATYKAWFTGHLHTKEEENLVGGTRYQMPSLSGPDRWHIENGYFGQAGLSGYIVDHAYGVIATLLCPAVDYES